MAVAIICECNPFHNGHKYLFETAKKLTGEPIIAIMSGSFTQRGEVAVADKFVRTKALLKNGADLVVELPVAYAVSNAQTFAEGGIGIAKAFESVNYLAFGCENDDINELRKAAETIDNAQVKAELSRLMKDGDYYPRALQAAVSKVYGSKTAEMLSRPNNILALEYLRALKSTEIKPLPIKRTAVEHDSSKSCGEYASASYIRQLMREQKDARKFMPDSEMYTDIANPLNLEKAVLYKLRTISKEDIARLPDVSEGLENRIYEAIRSNNSVEEIITAIKTKRYTHSRISRIITCALLDIKKEDNRTPIEYVRVLGFSNTGSALLKSCKLNIVTSPSKGLSLGGNTEKLLKIDIRATDIAALAYDNVRNMGSDFVQKQIKNP